MRRPRAEYLQIRYKSNKSVTTALFYGVWADKRCPYWHKECFYTVGPVPRGLVDGKPWVSMPLSQNRFIMPNLPWVQTLYIHTSDATNQLATCINVWSVLWIMANHMCMALQYSSIRPSWSVVISSEAWLLEISVITITDVNRTWCLCMKHS